MRISTAALLIVALAAATAHAEGPISAERPGFSSGPGTVGGDRIQLEAGYQYDRDDDGADSDVHTLPLLLLRKGLGAATEVQIAWPGYISAEIGSFDIEGTSDASVALKHTLIGAPDNPFALAIYGSLSLPVGDREFTSDEVDPAVGAFWTWTPSSGPGWFGTVLVDSTDTPDGRTTGFANAVGLGWSVGENTGAFVEYFGLFGERAGPAHHLDGGFTWLLSQDLQVDVNAGIGLNERAGDFFFGLGIARRW